jgi:hypothetical protein
MDGVSAHCTLDVLLSVGSSEAAENVGCNEAALAICCPPPSKAAAGAAEPQGFVDSVCFLFAGAACEDSQASRRA